MTSNVAGIVTGETIPSVVGHYVGTPITKNVAVDRTEDQAKKSGASRNPIKTRPGLDGLVFVFQQS